MIDKPEITLSMPMMIKIAVVVSFLFMISEAALFITKRSKPGSVKIKDDKGSLLWIWIAITFSLTLGFNLANYTAWSKENYVIGFIGIIISSAGFILRWKTILYLKSAFTVDVAVSNSQDIKTEGVFAIVRHPSYLGLFLILFGFSLMMNTFLSVIVVTIPVFSAILFRIRVEEKVLKKAFGKKYTDYMRNTKKIFPYLY